jgi:hypothetical protein
VEYRQCKKVASSRYTGYLRFAITGILGAVQVLASGPLLAARIDLAASYTAEYNDNVRLVPTAPVSDLAHIVDVGAYYQQIDTGLEARILADVQYRQYSNGTFANEVRPSLDASETWFLTPGRFHWFVQDRLSQIAIDATKPVTPDNLETINIFTTGPTFIARLSPVDTFEAESRFNNSFYSRTSASDADRISAKGSWKHAVSSITDVAASLEAQRVNYAQGAYDNYRVYEAVVGAKTKRRHATVGVDLGGTIIDRQVLSNQQRPLVRLSLDYRPNSTTRALFTAESKYSDITEEILKLPLSQDPGVAVGNLFYGKGVDFSYERTWAPTKALLHLYARRRDYIDATPDEEGAGGSLEFSYDFNARFSAGAFGTYVETSYNSPTLATIADSGVGLSTQYRLRPALRWVTEVRWNRRDSIDTARTYNQFIAMVSLIYGHRPAPADLAKPK